jgi:hypothetical protein
MPSDFRLQDPSIGELLTAPSPLRVPDYQRDYIKLFPGSQDRYFLGAIMLARDTDGRLVIDGQQRLATITILLVVIRDLLAPIDGHKASLLHAWYVERDGQFLLTLNITDRDFFRDCILTFSDQKKEYTPKKRSCKLIRSAYDILHKEVEKCLASQKTAESRRDFLVNLYKFAVSSLQVISIEASDADRAVAMFETLNDRGVGLSTADLLKSWLLMKASQSSRRDVLNLWLQMEAHAGEGKLTPLIREAWLSRRGDVKARALYSDIKQYLIDHKRVQPKAFVEQLKVDIDQLVRFKECRTGNTVLDLRLKVLRYIGASKTSIVLLSVANAIGETSLVTTCRAIESLAIRHRIKFGYLDSAFDNALFASCKVFTERRDFSGGIQVLVQASPTDEEILSAGRRMLFKGANRRLAKMILSGLEEWLGRDGLVVNPDTKEVQLEHIRPLVPRTKKNPSVSWLRRIHSLGNLTLLLKQDNGKLSNKPFRAKRLEYRKSRLSITLNISKSEKWPNKAIDHRRDLLLSDLVRCWPQRLLRE